MTRTHFTWLALALLLFVGGPATQHLAAQEPSGTAEDSPESNEDLEDSGDDLGVDDLGDDELEEGEGFIDGPRPTKDEIEQILEGDEQVFAGGGYTYDPGDRRDPFISPFRRRNLLPSGPRPEGKAGLLIEEISLTGIFETPEGLFAQVRGGPKDKAYLLQAGDQLYDGDVVDVTEEQVVFNQIDNSPTATKPFREVIRRLSEK